MRCPQCEQKLSRGAVVCVTCGTKVRRPRWPSYSLTSLIVFSLVVAFAAMIVIPNLVETRRPGYESSAIGSLKYIGTAQSLFREADKEGDGNLDYGTLKELSEAETGGFRLVGDVLGSGTKMGYVFEATYSSSTPEYLWFATARPVEPGRTGDRYFCTNQEGVTFWTANGAFRLNSGDCMIPKGAIVVGR